MPQCPVGTAFQVLRRAPPKAAASGTDVLPIHYGKPHAGTQDRATGIGDCGADNVSAVRDRRGVPFAQPSVGRPTGRAEHQARPAVSATIKTERQAGGIRGEGVQDRRPRNLLSADRSDHRSRGHRWRWWPGGAGGCDDSPQCKQPQGQSRSRSASPPTPQPLITHPLSPTELRRLLGLEPLASVSRENRRGVSLLRPCVVGGAPFAPRVQGFATRLSCSRRCQRAGNLRWLCHEKAPWWRHSVAWWWVRSFWLSLSPDPSRRPPEARRPCLSL